MPKRSFDAARTGRAPRSLLVSVGLAAPCRRVPVNSDVRPRNQGIST